MKDISKQKIKAMKEKCKHYWIYIGDSDYQCKHCAIMMISWNGEKIIA